MTIISVPFPDDLREKAKTAASNRGLSLDEFVRICVATAVDMDRSSDPLFADMEVFTGDAPSDLAENHDMYLYEEDR